MGSATQLSVPELNAYLNSRGRWARDLEARRGVSVRNEGRIDRRRGSRERGS